MASLIWAPNSNFRRICARGGYQWHPDTSPHEAQLVVAEQEPDISQPLRLNPFKRPLALWANHLSVSTPVLSLYDGVNVLLLCCARVQPGAGRVQLRLVNDRWIRLQSVPIHII